MAKKEKRFTVYSESSGLSSMKIILDTRTGVQYLFFSDGSSGGLTPLLDREGKPTVQKLEDGKA